jgi:hypothetical protein
VAFLNSPTGSACRYEEVYHKHTYQILTSLHPGTVTGAAVPGTGSGQQPALPLGDPVEVSSKGGAAARHGNLPYGQSCLAVDVRNRQALQRQCLWSMWRILSPIPPAVRPRPMEEVRPVV